MTIKCSGIEKCFKLSGGSDLSRSEFRGSFTRHLIIKGSFLINGHFCLGPTFQSLRSSPCINKTLALKVYPNSHELVSGRGNTTIKWKSALVGSDIF